MEELRLEPTRHSFNQMLYLQTKKPLSSRATLCFPGTLSSTQQVITKYVLNLTEICLACVPMSSSLVCYASSRHARDPQGEKNRPSVFLTGPQSQDIMSWGISRELKGAVGAN